MPDTSSIAPQFRRRIELSGLGRQGTEVPFEATDSERAAIARHLDLVDLEALVGKALVRPWRQGAILEGWLKARVVQTCVITLEPFAATIEGSFERRFLPADKLGAGLPDPREVEIELSEEDPPEPLNRNGVELGDVVVEELSLALEPFPRRPDARLEDVPELKPDKAQPFAALAKLKR